MIRLPHLAAFFALTFGVSWACWLPAALDEAGMSSGATRALVYAGALGPGLAGVMVLLAARGREGWNELWRSVVTIRRLRPNWMLFVVLFYPAVSAAGLFIEWIATGARPDLSTGRALLESPASIPSFLFWVLVLGPLPEELGWRGFALDPMQRRWGAPAASLALGILWAAWHLPLFLVQGTYHHRLGLASVSFWSYGASAVALSFVLTGIYNGNGHSVLAAILFHFVVNLTGALATGSVAAEAAKAILLVAIVAAAHAVSVRRRHGP